MNDDDKNDLMLALYGQTDDEETEDEIVQVGAPPREDGPKFEFDKMTVMITDAGGAKYRVPSMFALQQQTKIIEAQARQIRQLTAQVRQLRNVTNGHTNDFNQVWKDLERKWD
jgi:transposase-like protein